MYSGIMIDTNNFMTKTGVRTFEAAAFLRRNGADVTRVRKLFREDALEYKAKADAVSQADDSVENIQSSGEMVKDALQTFDLIFDNIGEVNNLVQQMMEKVEKVDNVAINVAAISEEQAASSEEILATSTTMVEHAHSITENSETVAEGAKELTESAVELANQVNMFKVDREDEV